MSRTILPDMKSQNPLNIPVTVVRDELVRHYESAYGDYDKAGDVEDHAYYAGLIDMAGAMLNFLGIKVTSEAAAEAEPRDKVPADAHLVRLDDLPTGPVVGIRAVAEYVMMGDFEGFGWAHLVLGNAKKDGLFEDYDVLTSNRGDWGLQLVQFTVDLKTDRYEGMTSAQAKEPITDLLNRVVGDSDVEVRWVGPVIG